jgi:hypothetical protein
VGEVCYRNRTHTQSFQHDLVQVLLPRYGEQIKLLTVITAIYFFGISPSSLCVAITSFFPRHQVNLLWWVRSNELASIGGRWRKSKKIDRSNTAPSSKTFRDE